MVKSQWWLVILSRNVSCMYVQVVAGNRPDLMGRD